MSSDIIFMYAVISGRDWDISVQNGYFCSRVAELKTLIVLHLLSNILFSVYVSCFLMLFIFIIL